MLIYSCLHGLGRQESKPPDSTSPGGITQLGDSLKPASEIPAPPASTIQQAAATLQQQQPPHIPPTQANSSNDRAAEAAPLVIADPPVAGEPPVCDVSQTSAAKLDAGAAVPPFSSQALRDTPIPADTPAAAASTAAMSNAAAAAESAACAGPLAEAAAANRTTAETTEGATVEATAEVTAEATAEAIAGATTGAAAGSTAASAAAISASAADPNEAEKLVSVCALVVADADKTAEVDDKNSTGCSVESLAGVADVAANASKDLQRDNVAAGRESSVSAAIVQAPGFSPTTPADTVSRGYPYNLQHTSVPYQWHFWDSL